MQLPMSIACSEFQYFSAFCVPDRQGKREFAHSEYARSPGRSIAALRRNTGTVPFVHCDECQGARALARRAGDAGWCLLPVKNSRAV